ncbi:membrane protein [Beggiatoa sp. PS]|nr:membrane protein [Beggiatoa sp. PS]
MPKGISSDFYCQAHQNGHVFFARSLQHEAKNVSHRHFFKKETAWLEPLPKLPDHCDIQFGIVAMPPQTHGIYRQQYTAFEIKGQTYPALEVLAAQHFLAKNPLLPLTSMWDFLNPSLPFFTKRGNVEKEKLGEAKNPILPPFTNGEGIFEKGKLAEIPPFPSSQSSSLWKGLRESLGVERISFHRKDTLYRIHFSQFDRIPKLKLKRILAGGLINDLVEQRSVIVGLTRLSNVPGLHTPLTLSHNLMISTSEYHALALNTLLSQQPITRLNLIQTFLLLLVLMIMASLIYQRLSFRYFWLVTLIFSGLHLVIAWLLYEYAHFWVPLFEIIMAQILWYWIYFKNKVYKTETALCDTLITNSQRLENKLDSRYFMSPDYWAQLVVMLHDILALNRLIILEWQSELKYIHEVKALNCCLNDIKKRRYQQQPYTIARRNRSAFHLKKALLKPIETAEEQFLVPLFFGDELQGFWILTIESRMRHDFNDFTNSLSDFANQLGELLYHRQQWQCRINSSQQIFNRLPFDNGNKLLEQSMMALEHRLTLLENILDHLETATILYNLFGMTIKVNQRMKTLSQTFGLTPYQTTAVEFLAKIALLDRETAQHYFYHILFHQEKIVQQVKLSASDELLLVPQSERFFLLNMQLFSYQDGVDGKVSKQGILCQLVDVTQIKLHSTLKEQLAERLIVQCRQQMQSFLTTSQSNTGVDNEKSQGLAGLLMDKMKMLDEVETQLNKQIDVTSTTKVEIYPINAKQSLFDAMANLMIVATKPPVKFHYDLPETINLVFASPKELVSVITTLLSLLIEDAVPNSQILTQMVEQDNQISYRFHNQGFGMPDVRFQHYLFSHNAEVSGKFKDIRHAIKLVKIWKGTLTASSEVGRGISFELRLRSFI